MAKMSWQNEPLVAWVTRGNLFWANEKIRHWHEVFPQNNHKIPIQAFILKKDSKRADIDVSKVVGQWDHYAGQTWLDALMQPGYKSWKIENTIRLFDENGSYYFDDEEKSISFDSIDGEEWFSNGGGNHRTVIGKFAFAMAEAKTKRKSLLKNVFVNQYTIDWESYNLFKQFIDFIKNNKVYIHIIVNSRNNEPIFDICDNRFHKTIILHERLRAAEFKIFSEWVIRTSGTISIFDKIKFWLTRFFGDADSLIYSKLK